MGEAAEEWEALLGLLAARLDREGAEGPSPEEQISLLRRCLFIAGERVDRPRISSDSPSASWPWCLATTRPRMPCSSSTPRASAGPI